MAGKGLYVRVKGKRYGRKPITDCTKKEHIQFKITGCIIAMWGGKEKAKRAAMFYLEKGPDELPKIKKQ